MRGIMVQSLVSRGIPFEVALKTANAVRDELAGTQQVHQDDLEKLVRDMLGDEHRLDDLPSRPDRPPPLVKSRAGDAVPFSKGILAVSLQGAGLYTGDAQDVARELEQRLIGEGRSEIERDELRDLVSDTIERTHGLRAAQRYRVWRQALEDGKPVFVLVGGSTGVGKTSIAVEIGRRLQISHVIGTDSIRQIMRLMFSEDLMPEIHASTYDAHEMLDRSDEGDAVIASFRDQAQKIAVGVQALIERALEERNSLLIEGVNLLPSLVDLTRYEGEAHVVQLVVAALDPSAWRSRFHERQSVQETRAASRYLDHFEQIRLIQDHILQEADHFGLQIIDNTQFDDAVVAATRSVIATLNKSLGDSV